jgi:hypothetical protein
MSIQGETDTPVFVGGNFNVADAGGYVSITNDGVGVSMTASAISLGGSIGAKIDVGDREPKGSVGATIGYQTGFKVSVTKTGIVLDVSFIAGVRIELSWGRKE